MRVCGARARVCVSVCVCARARVCVWINITLLKNWALQVTDVKNICKKIPSLTLRMTMAVG